MLGRSPATVPPPVRRVSELAQGDAGKPRWQGENRLRPDMAGRIFLAPDALPGTALAHRKTRIVGIFNHRAVSCKGQVRREGRAFRCFGVAVDLSHLYQPGPFNGFANECALPGRGFRFGAGVLFGDENRGAGQSEAVWLGAESSKHWRSLFLLFEVPRNSFQIGVQIIPGIYSCGCQPQVLRLDLKNSEVF